MRTVLILSVIIGLALSKTLADYPRNPLDIAQYQSSDFQTASITDERLCTPCKQLFTSVKDKLEELGKYDRETLKPLVKEYCHTYYGKIEKLEQLCHTLSERALDKLADWIDEENGKIDPERACVAAHLC
ncbi:unnamed protein product [Bursaphelenchus xylophilus]|uniref:(pine wood nematode) hypothetical protein n=1 Tax=Bursaphelenchus xylophilus TaxID=6326 RepID=A0A1I7SW30_BURXY|nr:unnamed protein product [Bursaphelenchus xylophilus]CAG9098730.1 unnamed protein product [Bursaphelenchus xylophilus]